MRKIGFFKNERASTAVEFGLIAAVFVGMMLGIIDMARLVYEVNSAKAAARRGARVAVVSLPAVSQLINFDAITACSIPGGQPIPENAPCVPADSVCTSTGCGSGTFVKANFDTVFNAMSPYYRRLQPANVQITYGHRGLGTSGFIGSDIEPLITVRIINMTFQPVSLRIFGVTSVPIPSVATTLTAESLGATSAAI